MDFQAFGLRCTDIESAENVKDLLETVGYVVEPYGEWAKRRRNRGRKLKRVMLVVDLPKETEKETAEMIVARSEIEKNNCVTLVL